MSTDISPEDVLSFWRNAGEKRWWEKDEAFDAEIRAKFLDLWTEAAAGKFAHWQESDEGALALAIVLDQFPRNMFRDDPRTYATDLLAQDVARRAVERGVDTRLPADLRNFLYMPFMHSEELADHERCVALFEALGQTENAKWAVHHADIVRRFGRFPHRNRLLGRTTTAEEQAFLDSGGFSG
ncbi:DUF924 family protein [Bradyrhizobium sp. LHD-71]|uniref:DUF924 family protein n=1 Tax=Bradyrhizobium sp. LHD-71 TaxID=3072141 RepID=UPI00280DA2D3|nr:DUF924 family protein [Bradyrhizobium sp. LHD-71]MDQ8727071.1 DUF924 family protein [Bradyrhizobium sp. LHD-71]